MESINNKINLGESLDCEICGGHYKKIFLKKHCQSQLHQEALKLYQDNQMNKSKAVQIIKMLSARVKELEEKLLMQK